MQPKAKEFFDLVSNNKMVEAKQVFTDVMQKKMIDTVSNMRKDVASKFFNKAAGAAAESTH